MSFKILVVNRSAKFLGTLVKTFSYLFHFVFPKKRFTIPFEAKSLIKSKQDSKIPKIIWQTNYTNKVSLPVYVNYLFNRLLNADFEYRYMGHETREKFIKDNAPKELSEAFNRLNDGAAQADLWRLFVLNYYGGVYMDIDAHSVWSISSMINKEDEYCFLLNKQHFTNYFIASSPNNKYLSKAIDIILSNIEQNRVEKGVYALTGPIVLNKAIGEDIVNYRYYKYTCIQGSFTNEYFQYIDKPRGKWTHISKDEILKSEGDKK